MGSRVMYCTTIKPEWGGEKKQSRNLRCFQSRHKRSLVPWSYWPRRWSKIKSEPKNRETDGTRHQGAKNYRDRCSCARLGEVFSLGRWESKRAGPVPAVALSTGCRTSRSETHPVVLSRPRGPRAHPRACGHRVVGRIPCETFSREGRNGAAFRACSPKAAPPSSGGAARPPNPAR